MQPVQPARRCGTGTTWGLSYARFGCRSELCFEHVDPATNLARWRILYERRDEIMSHFDGELIFDDLPKVEDSQVRLRAAIDAVGGVPNVVAPTDSTDV